MGAVHVAWLSYRPHGSILLLLAAWWGAWCAVAGAQNEGGGQAAAGVPGPSSRSRRYPALPPAAPRGRRGAVWRGLARLPRAARGQRALPAGPRLAGRESVRGPRRGIILGAALGARVAKGAGRDGSQQLRRAAGPPSPRARAPLGLSARHWGATFRPSAFAERTREREGAGGRAWHEGEQQRAKKQLSTAKEQAPVHTWPLRLSAPPLAGCAAIMAKDQEKGHMRRSLRGASRAPQSAH